MTDPVNLDELEALHTDRWLSAARFMNLSHDQQDDPGRQFCFLAVNALPALISELRAARVEIEGLRAKEYDWYKLCVHNHTLRVYVDELKEALADASALRPLEIAPCSISEDGDISSCSTCGAKWVTAFGSKRTCARLARIAELERLFPLPAAPKEDTGK